jgi:hypothetical protein
LAIDVFQNTAAHDTDLSGYEVSNSLKEPQMAKRNKQSKHPQAPQKPKEPAIAA